MTDEQCHVVKDALNNTYYIYKEDECVICGNSDNLRNLGITTGRNVYYTSVCEKHKNISVTEAFSHIPEKVKKKWPLKL